MDATVTVKKRRLLPFLLVATVVLLAAAAGFAANHFWVRSGQAGTQARGFRVVMPDTDARVELPANARLEQDSRNPQFRRWVGRTESGVTYGIETLTPQPAHNTGVQLENVTGEFLRRRFADARIASEDRFESGELSVRQTEVRWPNWDQVAVVRVVFGPAKADPGYGGAKRPVHVLFVSGRLSGADDPRATRFFNSFKHFKD